MFASDVRHSFHVPRFLPAFLFGASAVIVALALWATIDHQFASDPRQSVLSSGVNPEAIRSIAFIEPGGDFDHVMVHSGQPGAAARRIVSFSADLRGLHARGSASPTGDLIAVLSVPYPVNRALLTLVPVGAGVNREVAVTSFDYLSALSWSPDGARLALVRSEEPDASGLRASTVFEVAVSTGIASPVARFEKAFEVAPVGYSVDGARLYIVVIDQSGSKLWMLRDEAPEPVAQLSAGRTHSWALSLDGSRLAFVDSLAEGQRNAGRSLVLATGSLIHMGVADDQLGPAWQAGLDVPLFGGPGGTLGLSEETLATFYLIPSRFSPDGSMLAATIYPANGDEPGAPAPSLEIISPGQRLSLSFVRGAGFLGWVQDTE